MKVKRKPKTKIYGNHIKAILKEKGMSLQELADITGIAPSHISIIMSGKRRCISLPIAFKITDALQNKVEDVFIYKKPQEKKQI
jgi:DNA-binding Xre family transcriptional regulator